MSKGSKESYALRERMKTAKMERMKTATLCGKIRVPIVIALRDSSHKDF